MSKLESEFQSKLVKELQELIPECLVLVKPGFYVQGFPDLMVLYKTQWVALECKRKTPTRDDDYEPNQEWWIRELDEMGYAAMICPENRKEIIDEVFRTFGITR